jgi:two-component system OmpR family sensor kinase
VTYGAGSVAHRRQNPRAAIALPAGWASRSPVAALPGGILVALLGLLVTAPLELAVAPAPTGSTEVLLALLAVMASTGAAVLAGVCARLAPSPPVTWSAVLLGSYGLIVLPLTTGVLGAPTAETDGAWRAEPAPLALGTLRLLGVLAVAGGVLVLARRTLHAALLHRGELARRLAVAAEHRRRATERAAHRDHEIRNGLSGLCGISELVRASSALRERERLRVAVENELTRLHTLLQGAEPVSRFGSRPGPGLS